MAERGRSERSDRNQFRIGIHQGDIVVQGGDIVGHGVNITQRIQSLAGPGEIDVSARVQEDAIGR